LKQGDDEMTVVVPPPNSSKLTGKGPKDADASTKMDVDDDEEDEEEVEVPVDPKVKAVQGNIDDICCGQANVCVILRYQSKLPSSRKSRRAVRCPIHSSSFEI
jgi:hypothetical protein